MPVVLESSGYCPTCGAESTFVADHPTLRDNYLCVKCKSIPRERALMHVVETYFPTWEDLTIHEAGPSKRWMNLRLPRKCRHYIPSQLFSDKPHGSMMDGVRCEDIESLTFKDNSIDLHITQDVMEHVFRPELAFKELARTLKPGGAHVFSVPLVNRERASKRRAAIDLHGVVTHQEPPQYHGNPVSSNGSLVTMDWGFDIVRHIFDASGLVTHIIYIDDITKGIRARLIEVLVSFKL